MQTQNVPSALGFEENLKNFLWTFQEMYNNLTLIFSEK